MITKLKYKGLLYMLVFLLALFATNIYSPERIVFGSADLLDTATFTSSGSDMSFVKDGDSLIVQIKTKTPCIIDGNMITIGNKDVPVNKIDDSSFKASLLLTSDFSDGDIIGASFLLVDKIDEAKTQLCTLNNDFTYLKPITLSSDIMTDNSFSERTAINGNTITFSVSSPRKIQFDGVVKIGNSSASVTEYKENNSYIYEAKVKVDSSIGDDGQNLSIDVSSLAGKDQAGNPVTITPPAKEIKYYRPVIISENNLTTNGQLLDGTYYLRDESIVTVKFMTNRPIEKPSGNLSGQAFSFTSKDNMNWTGTVLVTPGAFSDNTVLTTNIVYSDEHGNTGNISNVDYESLIYYAPITIRDLSFLSSNKMESAAKNGDTLTLAFQASHPVSIVSGFIEDNSTAIPFTSDDGMNWLASYKVKGNIPDLSNIHFHFVIGDNAKNDEIVRSFENLPAITYYAPLKVSEVRLFSDNARNPSRYLKNEDTANVAIITNHGSTIVGQINGNNAEVTGDGSNWVAASTISAGEMSDLSFLNFAFEVNDIAGNEPIQISNKDIQNTLQYFAPLSVQSSSLSSSNVKNSNYAKDGDILTASYGLNHGCSFSESSIHGQTSSNSGSETTTLTAAVTAAGGSQGTISYNASFDDVAGNMLSVNNMSNITFDSIAPHVSLAPIFEGFTNQSLNITASYSDANLDPSDVKFGENGTDRLGPGEVTGDSFSKTISLSNDGEYVLSASASDKAGNTANTATGKVIIDKTNPRITAFNIKLDQAQAFKSGFVIADYFKIDDQYLRDIQCTLTNRSASGLSQAWNIDAPIWTDSLYSMSLSATDMATNISNTIRCDFYIDATPPKPIVKDTESGRVLQKEKINTLGKTAKIDVELDKIWVGSEKPDHITRLEVIDKDGNKLNKWDYATPQQETTIDLKDYGVYTLVIEAEDDVGNETERLTYQLELRDGGLVIAGREGIMSNKVISPWILIAGGIVFLGAMTAFIIWLKRKKGRVQDESEG